MYFVELSDCDNPLVWASDGVGGSRVTASTTSDTFEAHKAALGNNLGFWKSGVNSTGQWIQVNIVHSFISKSFYVFLYGLVKIRFYTWNTQKVTLISRICTPEKYKKYRPLAVGSYLKIVLVSE